MSGAIPCQVNGANKHRYDIEFSFAVDALGAVFLEQTSGKTESPGVASVAKVGATTGQYLVTLTDRHELIGHIDCVFRKATAPASTDVALPSDVVQGPSADNTFKVYVFTAGSAHDLVATELVTCLICCKEVI